MVTLRLVRWKPQVKNTLRGFATVELPIGLTIIECPVHVNSGRLWAALPAKAQIDQDGRHRRDNGKLAYSPVLEWATKELRDRFSQRVVEIVRQTHPEAFES